MTFRTKLLLISSLTMAGAVALVTGVVSVAVRRAFERADSERREALLTQFQQELTARGRDISGRVEQAASSVPVQQIEASSAEYTRAQTVASSLSLDYLDVLDGSGTILSSAHWPARFGFKNNWGISAEDLKSKDAFLVRIAQPEGRGIGLIAVRRTNREDIVAGGMRLGPELLKSLGTAPGMRALLWLAPEDALPARFMDGQGALENPQKLQSLVDQARSTGKRTLGSVQWTDRASAEAFLAVPLSHHGETLGVLLAATSLKEQLALERSILWTGVVVATTGIGLGLLLGWWTTERVTRPIEKLAAGARAVAHGDWSAQVDVSSHDEFGLLAESFNHMTHQLLEHRERAIQAERVAAWRELARRLAHELKNPLFPLQITIENLQRARSGPEFDEVFQESTQTLLEELSNLKTIIGRFGDFAKMPAPEFADVDLNELTRSVWKLYDARLHAEGKPPITCDLDVADEPLHIEADGEQLRRALGNLVLNAMDAMQAGGTLRVAVKRTADGARISISDTGQGLTPEECSRLFTPYYTTKQHGTGLGLAIVQSVVSDHHGKIQVQSQPGEGTTFVIDLPEGQPRE